MYLKETNSRGEEHHWFVLCVGSWMKLRTPQTFMGSIFTQSNHARNQNQSERREFFLARGNSTVSNYWWNGSWDFAQQINNCSISQFGISNEILQNDPFAVLNFCYSRKRHTRSYFDSQCAFSLLPLLRVPSDWAFSIVKKLITPDRSILSCQYISQITLAG